MKFICSLMVVEDIARAKYFYEELLGQKVKDDFCENVSFHGGFAIHEKNHFNSLINNIGIKREANNFELYFEEDDLENLESILRGHNIEFIHPIVEQPWKQNVMRFYDYDKNIIEVGERMECVAYRLYEENYSVSEICKITFLSEDTVRKTISKPLNT